MFYNNTKTRRLYYDAVTGTLHTDNVVIFYKEGHDRIAIAEGGRIALRERVHNGKLQWVFDVAAASSWCECWADLQGVDSQLLNTIDNGEFIKRVRYALEKSGMFSRGFLSGLSSFYGSGHGGDLSYNATWFYAFRCGLMNMTPDEIYEGSLCRSTKNTD
ncbi:hypothetical protein E2G06_19165 [Salmonella enterica subsp. enterica]|nr:hypothetical protein [Salmonella enterica subsp. enterica serovar Suberu]ECI7956935.1 hypothetical protein [Salmonella enterica subsp. enterica]